MILILYWGQAGNHTVYHFLARSVNDYSMAGSVRFMECCLELASFSAIADLPEEALKVVDLGHF